MKHGLSFLSFVALHLMTLWACAFAASVAHGAPRPAKADHLVFMVFDQMRPEYIDRFHMKNFKKLRARSRNYPQAWLGHLAAETVMTHAVLTTGRAPKELPWQNDLFFDRANLLGRGGGAAYSTGSLSAGEFKKALGSLPPETFLAHGIKSKLGGKVFAAGTKNYAALIMGGPHADAIVTLSKKDGVCKPSGINVPAYISGDDRFQLQCKDDFGTAGSLYPYDGARSIPGPDQRHEGGDLWTADVAARLMDRESQWRALFLTFAGIDKAGHLSGDVDETLPKSYDPKYSFKDAVDFADEALGRVLAKLREKGLDGRTLIVITADHGAQTNLFYLGRADASHGGENLVNDDAGPQPYFIDRILRTGRVQYTYQNTFVNFWLKPAASAEDEAGDRKVERLISEISGLLETYRLRCPKDAAAGGCSYERIHRNFAGAKPSDVKWAKAHHQELVDSMATPGAPHLVGLLASGVGFDLLGDHGGAQEKVQRVPLLMAGPGVSPGSDPAPVKSREIPGRIGTLLGLK